ncbi:MAG: hypothetical protein H6729_16745 [Deltaproteobacteria bacterium]|nr:hypothetical protein [Deltaproteobacteria bacterium]
MTKCPGAIACPVLKGGTRRSRRFRAQFGVVLRFVLEFAFVFVSAFASLFLSACQGDAGPRGRPAFLSIENQSQYDLLELRVHAEARYLDAQNLLTSPLRPGDALALYRSGDLYVTVYRERYQLGPIYAFTTAYPVRLSDDTGYRLIVFDESFRVEEIEWRASGAYRLERAALRAEPQPGGDVAGAFVLTSASTREVQ